MIWLITAQRVARNKCMHMAISQGYLNADIVYI